MQIAINKKDNHSVVFFFWVDSGALARLSLATQNYSVVKVAATTRSPLKSEIFGDPYYWVRALILITKKEQDTKRYLALFWVDSGARTHDTRNHNPMLCQLSYNHHVRLLFPKATAKVLLFFDMTKYF